MPDSCAAAIIMRPPWVQKLVKKVQSVCWLYLTENFEISRMSDFKAVDIACPYKFFPITCDNSGRVAEFREQDRISEYCQKVRRGEIGFFAECGGRAAGSIWATVNTAHSPLVVRGYMRLQPNEALIHDIVSGSSFRGRGIGPFMVSKIATALLMDYRVSRIIIDVNVRNSASIRMMNKAGVSAQERALYLSLGGTLAFQKVWRHCH